MAVEYFKANSEVLGIVKDVQEQYHDDLGGARIGVIMRETAAKSRGQRVMGEASKVSTKNQVFMGLDFVLCFALDTWEELEAWQQRALVDEQLCACHVTDQEETRLLKYDVQMFKANFERFGFWKPFSEDTQESIQARLSLEMDGRKGEIVAMEPGRRIDIDSLFEEEGEKA